MKKLISIIGLLVVGLTLEAEKITPESPQPDNVKIMLQTSTDLIHWQDRAWTYVASRNITLTIYLRKQFVIVDANCPKGVFNLNEVTTVWVTTPTTNEFYRVHILN